MLSSRGLGVVAVVSRDVRSIAMRFLLVGEVGRKEVKGVEDCS